MAFIIGLTLFFSIIHSQILPRFEGEPEISYSNLNIVIDPEIQGANWTLVIPEITASQLGAPPNNFSIWMEIIGNDIGWNKVLVPHGSQTVVGYEINSSNISTNYVRSFYSSLPPPIINFEEVTVNDNGYVPFFLISNEIEYIDFRFKIRGDIGVKECSDGPFPSQDMIRLSVGWNYFIPPETYQNSYDCREAYYHMLIEYT